VQKQQYHTDFVLIALLQSSLVSVLLALDRLNLKAVLCNIFLMWVVPNFYTFPYSFNDGTIVYTQVND
jgi:hypothetical protein